MHIRRQAGARAGTAFALIGVTLLVAACGSSSSASTTTAGTTSTAAAAGYGGTPTPSTAASASAPANVKLGTAHGSAGTYLVGPTGRALYIWVADKNGTSSCSGSCAKAWPALTTSGSPQAGGGAMAADPNTIKRADGKLQVTYKGHPLYYFIADSGPGTTKGQGSNSFGAKWWLLAPSGSPITGGGTPSGSSSSSSSSSSSGGGGGWG